MIKNTDILLYQADVVPVGEEAGRPAQAQVGAERLFFESRIDLTAKQLAR